MKYLLSILIITLIGVSSFSIYSKRSYLYNSIAKECDICTIDTFGSCSEPEQKSEWFIFNLLNTSDYPARWNCGEWSSFTGWLFIISDLLIALAYFSLPIMIVKFAKKEKTHFYKILWLFAFFIFSCGIGHIMDAVMFYWPAYRLLAVNHAITAIISITTAISFYITIPKIIKFIKENKIETDLLHNLFEYSSIGKCYVSLEGKFIKGNPRLCRIIGYSEDELTNITFQEITHPDDLEKDLSYVKQMIDNEIDSYILEKRYYHKMGHIVWVELTVSMVKDLKNNNLHFIVEIMDINERKKHEEEIEKIEKEIRRSNKELESFAYVISHDLKAPLRGVDNLSQWIIEDVGDDLPIDAKDKLNMLRERVQRMQKLIDGLLEFSRIGRVDVDMQNISSTQSVKEIIDSLYTKNQNIEFNIKELPEIHANPIRFSQVMSNLIDNGVKYSEGIPHIEIGYKDIDDYFEFYVKDQGMGIEKQYHNKIFDMFTKLSPKDEENGVGVGLALVKRIVDQMGGNVYLESEIGKGSTFYFTWPKDPIKKKVQ